MSHIPRLVKRFNNVGFGMSQTDTVTAAAISFVGRCYVATGSKAKAQEMASAMIADAIVAMRQSPLPERRDAAA